MRYIKIWQIVVVMAVAMLGLIAIQLYWIDQASELNRQRFDQNVFSALDAVSKKLEAREAFGFVKKNVNIHTDKSPKQSSNDYSPRKTNENKVVLGVFIQDIDQELMSALDLKTGYGIYVDSVILESPAYYAGLHRGDIITEVGGKEVNKLLDLKDIMSDYSPGDEINLTYERLSQEKKAMLTDCYEPSQFNFDLTWQDISYGDLNDHKSEFQVIASNKDSFQVIIDSASRGGNKIVIQGQEEGTTYITSFNTESKVEFFPSQDDESMLVRHSQAHEHNSIQRHIHLEEDTNMYKLMQKVFDDTAFIANTQHHPEDIFELFKEQRTQIDNTFNMVNDIVAQWITKRESLEQRLCQFNIDDILAEELHDRGIYMEPEWVVTNSLGKPIFYNEDAEISNPDRYKAQLYSNDFFQEPSYITLAFNDRKAGQFMLGSIMVPLIAFIFILMIILSFYYAIHTLFKQKKISELKTDFINNMTHELKTPVSTIRLASEMVMDDKIPKDKGTLQRYMQIIMDENRRLGNQVEKVLQIAKYEKGEVDLNLEELNIHQVLDEVIQKTNLQIEQKNGVLNKVFGAANVNIQADKMHLSNIFYNLLDNAIKYTPDQPVIDVSTSETKEGLVVSVKDNGIGMNREVQKRIFEKFYREPTGDLHDVKGYGLGLSYVKLMTEAHGGEIRVKSRPNLGSLFELILPNRDIKLELS